MRRFSPHLAALALAALVPPLLGVDSCGQDLLSNAGFDLWCGDQLCDWVVEAGDIEKVPTWHERDYGASFVGSNVAISQLADDANSGSVECITFSLLADVDDGADLTVEMDFLDDGIAEWSAPIPGEDWEQVSFHVRPPDWFEGIRFRIRKTGTGRAVVAMVRAQSDSADACSGPPLALDHRPDGAPCTADGECDAACAETPVLWGSDPANGGQVLSYTTSTCGGCGADGDCPPGEVCGLDWEEYGERQCVPAALKSLGETCATDGECGTGICCEDQCSECCATAGQGCADSSACVRHDVVDAEAPALEPFVCGDARRIAGAACLDGDDCLSSTCSSGSSIKVCNPDGRPCHDDLDCPGWAVYLGATCTDVGLDDGHCL